MVHGGGLSRLLRTGAGLLGVWACSASGAESPARFYVDDIKADCRRIGVHGITNDSVKKLPKAAGIAINPLRIVDGTPELVFLSPDNILQSMDIAAIGQPKIPERYKGYL